MAAEVGGKDFDAHGWFAGDLSTTDNVSLKFEWQGKGDWLVQGRDWITNGVPLEYAGHNGKGYGLLKHAKLTIAAKRGFI